MIIFKDYFLMKRICRATLLIILILPVLLYAEFIQGVDISSLLPIENNGGIYTEYGLRKDALQIFRDHNINFVRLRIWHTPDDEYCNLDKTLLMAQRIKNAGLKFMLDLNYSDTWADPGKQSKPAAWENLSFQALKDSIHTYTSHVIAALKNQNTLPDIVQIGNEITCGMLWNDGRVCGQYNTPNQWKKLSELIDSAIKGVYDCCSDDDSVRIMIHVDDGGNNDTCRWFFDNLFAQDVDFDIIGLSFYPWWHGYLTELEYNINDLALRYEKDIIVVETAYPWTLDWSDNTHNIIGDSTQLLDGYPATVEGQKNFLRNLIFLISNLPGDRGLGLFYWAPEFISTKQYSSPWENVTLFDFYGEVLNSITVFDSCCVNISKKK